MIFVHFYGENALSPPEMGAPKAFLARDFVIVLGRQRSPQNSAHHEHQRFWPRVSEAAGELRKRRNHRKYRGFRAVRDIPAWRPPFLRKTHQCFEAGAADAHDARLGGVRIIEASLLLGDPGGEYQQHQQLLGAAFRAAGPPRPCNYTAYEAALGAAPLLMLLGPLSR